MKLLEVKRCYFENFTLFWLGYYFVAMFNNRLCEHQKLRMIRTRNVWNGVKPLVKRRLRVKIRRDLS